MSCFLKILLHLNGTETLQCSLGKPFTCMSSLDVGLIFIYWVKQDVPKHKRIKISISTSEKKRSLSPRGIRSGGKAHGSISGAESQGTGATTVPPWRTSVVQISVGKMVPIQDCVKIRKLKVRRNCNRLSWVPNDLLHKHSQNCLIWWVGWAGALSWWRRTPWWRFPLHLWLTS